MKDHAGPSRGCLWNTSLLLPTDHRVLQATNDMNCIKQQKCNVAYPLRHWVLRRVRKAGKGEEWDILHWHHSLPAARKGRCTCGRAGTAPAAHPQPHHRGAQPRAGHTAPAVEHTPMCPLITPWGSPPSPAQGMMLVVAWPQLLTPGMKQAAAGKHTSPLARAAHPLLQQQPRSAAPLGWHR